MMWIVFFSLSIAASMFAMESDNTTLSITCSDTVLSIPSLTKQVYASNEDLPIMLNNRIIIEDTFGITSNNFDVSFMNHQTFLKLFPVVQMIYLSKSHYSSETGSYLQYRLRNHLATYSIKETIALATAFKQHRVHDAYTDILCIYAAQRLEKEVTNFTTNEQYTKQLSDDYDIKQRIAKALAKRIKTEELCSRSDLSKNNYSSEQKIIRLHNKIHSLALNHENTLLALACNKGVSIANLSCHESTNQPKMPALITENYIQSVAFKPGSSLLAAGGGAFDSKVAQVYDAATKTIVADYSDTISHNVNAVTFDPHNNNLYLATLAGLDIIDTQTQKLTHSFPECSRVESIAVTNNGKLLVTGTDWGEIIFRDPASLQIVKKIKNNALTITSIAASPDEKYIAHGTSICSAHESAVHIWDVCALDKPLKSLTPYQNKKLVPFWHQIELGYNWINAYKDSIKSVAFSPDSNYIATASETDTVRIWNLEKESLSLAPAHTSGYSAIAFNATNNHLYASDTEYGTVTQWNYKKIVEYNEQLDTAYDEIKNLDQAMLLQASRHDNNFTDPENFHLEEINESMPPLLQNRVKFLPDLI